MTCAYLKDASDSFSFTSLHLHNNSSRRPSIMSGNSDEGYGEWEDLTASDHNGHHSSQANSNDDDVLPLHQEGSLFVGDDRGSSRGNPIDIDMSGRDGDGGSEGDPSDDTNSGNPDDPPDNDPHPPSSVNPLPLQPEEISSDEEDNDHGGAGGGGGVDPPEGDDSDGDDSDEDDSDSSVYDSDEGGPIEESNFDQLEIEWQMLHEKSYGRKRDIKNLMRTNAHLKKIVTELRAKIWGNRKNKIVSQNYHCLQMHSTYLF